MQHCEVGTIKKVKEMKKFSISGKGRQTDKIKIKIKKGNLMQILLCMLQVLPTHKKDIKICRMVFFINRRKAFVHL